ncbi:MAG: hypothetical protein E6J41_13880, partial [Chloroflexi bacterium]
MSDAKPELRLVGPGQADAGLATLELISQARTYLAEAKTVPDLRRLMAEASVVESAAKRAARLFNAERRALEVVEAASAAANDAAAVRIEAQAKAGELLAQMRERGEREGTGRTGEEGVSQRATPPPTLGQLGVSRSESSRWQQVAAIPAEDRASYVEATKAVKGEVSTAGLLRHVRDDAPLRDAKGDAAPSMAWDSPTARRQRELYTVMRALPTFPPGLVADLDGDESHRRFTQAARRVRAWLGDLASELRAVAPATSAELSAFELRASICDLVFELRGASAPSAVVKPKELAGAVEARDRPDLLLAVRDLSEWLA